MRFYQMAYKNHPNLPGSQNPCENFKCEIISLIVKIKEVKNKGQMFSYSLAI